ncbi:LuxR C-terminal-related transcriptional regulator [Paenibacillus alkalitolerans]|uniref:LuxR C-terminal-related transcriptional regulator n=1 Tax=Paenibacillus alkalitolerans TaxID=2799335 RepID=UPI0018F6C9E0|nr:LuxR C-terminal-related transcriptional regulator [Paenibacillus alkalitolerans]
MNTPIISTKLYIPATRTKSVHRPRLIERLNEGLHRKLSLISASAGFGKTTLVSEWLAVCGHPAAWLSLDEGDNDLPRFLTYLCAALQTIADNIGEGVLSMLNAPQPPSTESILTALLNEIAAVPNNFILVLDDYHVIDARPIDDALAFLLSHLPPQMHMVVVTRKDPFLPLARLRARNQLSELRISDLRFTRSETAEFLNRTMDLNLSPEHITLLETRTEGWAAGLQLAAISLQGHKDPAGFIESFSGTHHFVLDYLVEEVLQRQSESVQFFLLRTSILDRLCGPLCDAVMRNGAEDRFDPAETGQKTLDYLEKANLFLIPLDNERRWYRYHHLFAELLRQRMQQDAVLPELHIRASEWYENNGLELEAFRHAAAANDLHRAARLMEGGGMPLHFRGAVAPVLNWLKSLRTEELNAIPSLWVTFASVLLFVNQISGVEQKLQAAEQSLQNAEPDINTRDLKGHIASIRATLAVSQHQAETIIEQSQLALKYLHPDNLPVRTATTWTLGYAFQLQGDRSAAIRAYTEAITISEQIGHFIVAIMANIGLGNIMEANNQLESANETYRRVLELAGNPPHPVACEAHLGLARIFYEWNDLDASKDHAQQSIQLANMIENSDRLIAGEVFLARMTLAEGKTSVAAALLAKAGRHAQERNFLLQIPEVAAALVLVLIRQDKLAEAADLAQKYSLPISQARVHLAMGDTFAALAALEPFRLKSEEKGWENERLKSMVLQAIVLQAHGEQEKAISLLIDALAYAEPGGFIRLFVDEGIPMARLLSEAASSGMSPDYIDKLQAAFEAEQQKYKDKSNQTLIEPLSERELTILQLIAQGLSNQEICERLFLALSTVKGYNRNIYDKLQVRRRTEAVARGRELGLLQPYPKTIL